MKREKIAKPKKFRQNTDVATHYHPRWLARSIVHSRLKANDVYGMNQVKPGTTQSPFALHWRNEAELFSAK